MSLHVVFYLYVMYGNVSTYNHNYQSHPEVGIIMHSHFAVSTPRKIHGRSFYLICLCQSLITIFNTDCIIIYQVDWLILPPMKGCTEIHLGKSVKDYITVPGYIYCQNIARWFFCEDVFDLCYDIAVVFCQSHKVLMIDYSS